METLERERESGRVNTMAAAFCVDCGLKLAGQFCMKCGHCGDRRSAACQISFGNRSRLLATEAQQDVSLFFDSWRTADGRRSTAGRLFFDSRFLQDDSSGDDVQSHQERVEERQRDKSQDRRAAKRPKFSSQDPSTWKVSDMWWV